MTSKSSPGVPHVVIVGAGFGGLQAARRLASAPIRITMIDQRNYHLFQPLLYQVATASLATAEIAWPIRWLLRRYRNITTLLGTVVAVDTERKTVLLGGEKPAVPFDILVLATGSRQSYFGHDEWERYAPSLKTLDDAIAIRRRVLGAFEQAEWETDAARRARLLTFVIVGAGPTGVELAGTIAELARETLRKDFRNFDTRDARVVLVEAGPTVLPGFAPSLSAYARRALEKLGVEIKLQQAVSQCEDGAVAFGDTFLAARNIVWAAGVAASPAAQWLNTSADRAGRVEVAPDLSVPNHPDIFVIGDSAHVETAERKLIPGVAQAAKQQGRYVATVIRSKLRGKPWQRPFRYSNFGAVATIGKRAAIMDLGWLKLKGRLAWWGWGVAHIYFLIGLRDRLAVTLSWLWTYVSGQRGARVIIEDTTAGASHDPEQVQ
ncbi:FAD-dependent oxidoreductase [Burkholderia multivorans]|jgi:NADH dehydrogenase|uniref:NAD(P)/FAD-dependent oxidoreductase n=1 Tax=Burkholderia multivorans TaxID=87883 RepID=UPI000D0081E3|nr:NAD(P)/FAD-dependent oxidoreductase [Burkholderia multivorans]MBU9638031.1 NAD(P)/FAD-dependent oxidoreductase [Burkholderia multivorans]PRE99119.1 FAD-dependent oxidoreductase [Burkholderia multivorans]PRG41475.1 FAD-dependent oxidoreductase [Burkholderia multivorans]